MFNNVTIFLSPIPGAGQRDQAVHALQDRGVHLHQQVLLDAMHIINDHMQYENILST